jgi:hypothetical protein
MKFEEKERNAKIKKLESEIIEIPNPNKSGIDTCNHLINVCIALKKRSGLIIDQDLIAREAQSALDKERMQERMDKMMKEGKIENGMSKQ